MGKQSDNIMTPQGFSAKIKAKYPQYMDMDDLELAKRMVEKYPEYKDQVSFETPKKKEPTQPTSASTSAATSSAGQKKNNWVGQGGFKSSPQLNIQATEVPKKTEPKVSSSNPESIKKVVGDAKVKSTALEAVAPMASLLPKPIQSGVLSLGSGFVGLIGGISEMIGKNPKFMSMQNVADKAFEMSKDIAGVSEAAMTTSKADIGISDPTKSTFEHLVEGNLSDFGKSLVLDISAQVPQMAVTIGTGGATAAYAAIGATAAGSAMTQEVEQDGTLSALDFSQSLVKGGAEAYLSSIFNMDDLAGKSVIKGLDGVLSAGGAVLKQQIREQGKGQVKDKIIRSISDIAKEGLKGGGQEILEEDLIVLGSYLVDAIDEDKFNAEEFSNLVNDLGNSTLVAGFTGTPISITAARASQVKYSPEEQHAITKLDEIINNEDISPEAKSIAKKRLAEIHAGVSDKTLSNYESIAALPITDRVEILEKQDKIRRLEEDKKLSQDVDINDAIDERIGQLQGEIDETINKPKSEESSITLVDEVSGLSTTIQQEQQAEDQQLLGTQGINTSQTAPSTPQATQASAIIPPSGTPPQATQSVPSPQNPLDALKKSEDMMDRHDAALENLGKNETFWDKWNKRLFERQANIIRALGDSPEAKVAKAQMTVVAGARSRADELFKDKESTIYKGLDIEKERILDQALFHKRVIELDQKYDAAGKERLKHPELFNKEESEKALEGIKEKYGQEFYDDMNKRADEYFTAQTEILESLKDNGLIDNDTFDRFKDDDYIQRVFIDHINSASKSKSPTDTGLSKEQIKSLDAGSTGLLLLDSKMLLNAAYRSAQQRIFQNKANEALYKVLETGSEIGKPLKPTGKNKKTGGFNYGTAKPGYTKRRYFKDGKEVAFEIRNDYDAEWHDMEKSTTELDNWLRTLMGTALLKRMATGINSTFAIGNVPADFGNIIAFTDIFDDGNVYTSSFKLAKSFMSNAGQLALLNSTGKGSQEFKSLVDDFGKYGGNMEFLTTYGRPESISVRKTSERGVRGGVGKAIKGAEDALAFTGEVSEKAMRLAAFDKVRQDAFKAAGGKGNMTQEQIDQVNYEAAAKARKTMDFAKGGLWTKKLDAVSPYLNAAAQGTRVAADYVKTNPKKFTAKLSQIGAGVAALTAYNMMVGDDEDWDNIPNYEKNNYFIIFSPIKQEDGSRGYIRVKKTPALVPFLNFFEAGAIAAINQSSNRRFGASESFTDREWDAINDALPLPIDPRQLPNKLPPIPKGVISYMANYDFFRNQEIVRGKEKDIDEKFQGLYDKNIPLFYKEIGQKTGTSPRKLKAATEMVITNPSTNTIVGGAYALLDKLVAKTLNSPEEWLAEDKEVTSILGGAKARVYRRTNPNYASFNSDMRQKFEKEIRTQDYITRQEIKNIIDDNIPVGIDKNSKVFKESITKVKKELRELINSKEVSDSEKKTYANFADNYATDTDLKRSIPDYYKLSSIKYLEGSPESKAKLFAYEFGLIDPNGEEFLQIRKDMKKMKIPTSERFISEYRKIYNESVSKK